MEIVRSGTLNSGVGGRGCFWPTIARLESGNLAVVFSGGRLNHICPFGRVEICYSDDEGENWTPGAPILDTPLDDRDAGISNWNGKTVLTTFNNKFTFQRACLNLWPESWTEKEIAFLNAYMDSVPEEEQKKAIGSLICFSDDGGRHFGDYVKAPVTSPHGPLALSDGRLMWAGRNFFAADCWDDPKSPAGGIYVTFSESGKDWSKPQKIEMPNDLQPYEPHAVQYGNGEILVATRVHLKEGGNGGITIMLSRSIDGGKTFSAFEETGICGAPPHLLVLKDGRTVMTYGRRTEPFGIRAKVSRDRGLSWGEELTLRNDGTDWDLGYPASVELKNGNILTVYYIKRPGEKLPEIQYTVWKI